MSEGSEQPRVNMADMDAGLASQDVNTNVETGESRPVGTSTHEAVTAVSVPTREMPVPGPSPELATEDDVQVRIEDDGGVVADAAGEVKQDELQVSVDEGDGLGPSSEDTVEPTEGEDGEENWGESQIRAVHRQEMSRIQRIKESGLAEGDRDRMMTKGVIESDEITQEKEEKRELLMGLVRKLEGDEPLGEGDRKQLNEAFVFIDRRYAFLDKRERALRMDQVCGKYEEILDSEAGMAAGYLKPQEQADALVVYQKAKRPASLMEYYYGRHDLDTPDGRVGAGVLKFMRGEVRDKLYKKGMKLGDEKSMLSLEEIQAKRAELARDLHQVGVVEAGVSVSQAIAVSEYVKPENRISRREVIRLNDLGALALMRKEKAEVSERAMDKCRRQLGRLDLARNAVGFVERRLGGFGVIRELAAVAKGAIERREKAAAEKYNNAEAYQKRRALMSSEDKQREDVGVYRAIRKEVAAGKVEKPAAGEDPAKQEKEAYMRIMAEAMQRTLLSIKETAQEGLRRLLDRKTLSLLAAFGGIMLTNVLVGAGLPAEVVGVLGLSFVITREVADRGIGLISRLWRGRARVVTDASAPPTTVVAAA